MSQAFQYDFFISRRETVAAASREVADVLRREGYRVIVEDYDFRANEQFVADIDTALKQCRDLLILHTHDYGTTFWTRQEFHGFQAARGTDERRRIAVLRCDDAVPGGLLAGVTFGILHGVTDPDERRDIILKVARGEAPSAPPAPRVFGGATMPPVNRLFTGRADLLALLHAALARNDGHAALTQKTAQAAVHGLGGVGKTSLAREYVHRFEAEYPGGVWWLAAGDAARVADELAALAHEMIPGLRADMPPAEAAAAALAELERRHAPFLLVYDNAPEPAALRGLLPKRGARALITSRYPGWDRQAAPVAVDVLAEADAVALLLKTAHSADAAGAGRLARELGFLPLALDHAGAYCRETLTGFDACAARVEALIHEPGGDPEYPRSVAATLRLAIDAAAERAPAAADVLGQLAWFAPERIPLLLLDLPAEARGAAVAALINLSLLRPAEQVGAELTVSVHRLVQAVARDRQARSGGGAAAQDEASRRLAAAFPFAYNEPGHWPLCRVLLPHMRSLVDRLPADSTAPDLPRLLNLAGSFLQGSGDAAAALPLYRRALESSERVLGAEHPDTLGSVNNLAYCLQTLGDAAAALPLYRRALDSRERVLGAEHPQTLTSVNNLADCLQTLGDAAAALPLFRRALESRERVLGAAHPQTLTSVNNLAGCLRALGDAAAALPLYRRALDSCERVLGAEHPQTLTSVNNLAYCLQTLGDAAAALPLYRRALESGERVLGAEHPDTLGSVNNLAYCLQTLGDAAGALPLYRRALESRERVLGAEHPDTLGSVNNLAGCLETLGDAAAALPLYRRALESRERVLGAAHPDTLTSVNNLAGCLRALGDAPAALPLYRRALESRERVLGAAHPQTLTSVNNLAGCLRALGDAAAALPLFRRALESGERVLGAEHPDTLGSVNNLAGCLQTLGDAAGALPLYRRALESRERVLGAAHPDTLGSVNNLAYCLQTLGDAAGALPLFRRAAEGIEQLYGPDHPSTRTIQANLAIATRATAPPPAGPRRPWWRRLLG